MTIIYQEPEDSHYHETQGWPERRPAALTPEELRSIHAARAEEKARADAMIEEIEQAQMGEAWPGPIPPHIIVRWHEGVVEAWTGYRWRDDLRRARRYLVSTDAGADLRGAASLGFVVREDRLAEWSREWGEL